MLHLTNGYSGVDALRAAGIDGDVVPWRDVLHEGPVPALPPPELRSVRAAFLAELGWGAAEAIERDFAARDERLARAERDGEPVVLWFEDDLYDVLQMVEILARLDHPTGDVGLVLTGVDRWQPLTALSPNALRHRLRNPPRVTLGHLGAARRLYRALRAPRPEQLTEALASAAGLPGGRRAARRLLEQIPWATDGLTRSERQLLRAAADGARTPADAYTAAQRAEERPFLGDLTAFAYLARMSPLVTGEPLELTDYGWAVLEGRRRWEDRPSFHLGGAWIGPWRWDPAEQAVRPAASGP